MRVMAQSHAPTTVCISNIANVTTTEDLATHLESKYLKMSEDHTDIIFTRIDVRSKRTTVTFIDRDTLSRALALPFSDRRLHGRTLIFDAKFEGMTVLYEGDPSLVE